MFVLGREYDKKILSSIADEMHSLYREISHLKWFVDGSNRSAVNECKAKFGERTDWEKSENINIEDCHIISLSFSKDHKTMLKHCYHINTKHKLKLQKTTTN